MTSVSRRVCPLNFSYFVWSDSLDNWIEQSTNSAPFSDFDATDGTLTVYTTDFGIFQPPDATSMTFKVKWTIRDPYSNSANKQIEEVFDLTVEDICAGNTLTQVYSVSEVTHFIQAASATTVQPEVISSAAWCPFTFKLFFYDELNFDWTEYTSSTAASFSFVQSFDASSGEIKIYTTDFGTYDNYSVRVWILAIDERSNSAQNSVNDYFNLYVKDECRDVVIKTGITGFSGTEASPYSWHIW